MQKKESFWLKGISHLGSIRCVYIQAESLIDDLRSIHGLDVECSDALGEAMISALMVSSFCKQGERVNLTIQGDGRIRQAFVDADSVGTVRAYLLPGDVEESGKSLWGRGTLSVLRTQALDGKKPYIGTIPLLYETMHENLSEYWSQSEQIVSALAFSKKAKAGVLIQVLGGASEEEINQVRQVVTPLRAHIDEICSSADPLKELGRFIDGKSFVQIEKTTLDLKCSCSFEKAQKALLLVGEQELQSILDHEGFTSIHCDFCVKNYTFGLEAIEKILQQIREKNQS